MGARGWEHPLIFISVTFAQFVDMQCKMITGSG